MTKKRMIAIVTALAIVIAGPHFEVNPVFAEESGSTMTADNGVVLLNSLPYREYMESFDGEKEPSANVYLSGASYSAEENAGVVKIGDLEGKSDVIKWDSEQGSVEWVAEIPESGLYNIGIDYFPLSSKGRSIELSVEIDGEVPFDEADRLIFPRVWKDAEDIRRDNQGNDIRPRQVEVPMWLQSAFQDTDGLHNNAYKFYLAKGNHRIKLRAVREAFALAGLHIYQEETIPNYNEVLAEYTAKGYKKASGDMLKFQAEEALFKSHSTLYPMYDRSSAATEPAHPSKIRLNTIGQWNWSFQGEWISWKVDVPEDGLYKIAFRARQNFVRGMYSTRKLYIDGKVPFREMENVKFPYKLNWYTKVLGDDDPHLFYLTKGEHELKLEITPGDISETLQVVQSSIRELNNIYRRIIMITGSSPDPGRSSGNSIDPYRDYRLDEKIPGLIEDFTRIREQLQIQLNQIDTISTGGGNEATILEDIVRQLDSFILEPDTIPVRLDRFKNNVSSLGSWILNMRQQPLELDYIAVLSADRNPPKATANLFAQAWYDAKAFFASFIEDYNSIGNVYGGNKAISVWVSASEVTGAVSGVASGRDQAQIIKSMIDDLFTPQTGIQVNLSLVESSQTLVQATLAGKGPDVAMFVPKETPVNLAMRGALTDLSQFEGYDRIKERFYESALIPFEYEGGHYALPETQDFYMLFYRKDIFSELGIKIPNTWADFYAMVPMIQKKNMDIGIPSDGQMMFETLLFQRGGQFYADDHKSTRLDQPEALEAFREWTGFYSKYSLPLQFDFYNRFRTGEMPVGIMPYTMYNLLSVAAPELRNMWGMAPIPATPQADGSMNRMSSSGVTGSILLKDAKDPEAAFQFIDWWTSEEVQARFGVEQESLMGPAARYNTANIAAFDQLPWSKAEADNLKTQWKDVWDIPQLPGNYYTYRNVTFAFRKVVYDNKNERETLNKYNQEINDEIVRKRAEFHLN